MQQKLMANASDQVRNVRNHGSIRSRRSIRSQFDSRDRPDFAHLKLDHTDLLSACNACENGPH